ncbi:MAG: CsbD family protein [Rhodopirellula sp.]|nr:CsbD family protein [Rhodopirellula sp.]
MNWEQIQGDWKQFTGKVKEKWGKLTDDELTEIDGRREQFVGRLQEKYGYGKEQAEKELSAFVAALKPETAPAEK